MDGMKYTSKVTGKSYAYKVNSLIDEFKADTSEHYNFNVRFNIGYALITQGGINMKELIVKSQAELDAVPSDYDGTIIIEFGTPGTKAVVNRAFYSPVVLRTGAHVELLRGSAKLLDNSYATLRNNSSVELLDNSSADLRDNSSASLHDHSSAVLWDNSSAKLWGASSASLKNNSSAILWNFSSAMLRDNSSASLHDHSSVGLRNISSAELWDNSSADLVGNSYVELWDSSSAVLWDNSSATLRGNSFASLRDNSFAVLWDSSTVTMWEESSAELWGNSQAFDVFRRGNIKTSANARVVYSPSSIDEYIGFYGIETDGNKVKLFKAVHFDGENYFSSADPTFIYTIGETVKPTNRFNGNPIHDCGAGIHLAYKAWAVDYGQRWDDLAILELEAEKCDILVPLYGNGKVRAKKAKVLREVPLEECGLLGKMIANR